MAAERPATPEKQLLKLIEEHKTKSPASVQAKAVRHRGLSFLSLGAWLGRFSFSKDWFRKKLNRFKGQPLDIKWVNKALLFCIYIFSAYFAVSLTVSLLGLTRLPNFESQVSGSAGRIDLTQRVLLKKAVSSYLEKVNQRDIFRMGEVRQVTGTDGVQTTVKVTSQKILDATDSLKLVGISWSSDPDAIIEDTKDMKTFFVKTGQKIGDVKVQAIFKDKVVLSYEGEETELK